MLVHEYQAREILERFGVPVPPRELAASPEEAAAAFRRLAVPTVMVKAQVRAGGRGKAGGVRPASSPDEASRITGELLSKPLVTAQTGPAGKPVECVLLQPRVEIERELYAAVVLDPPTAGRAKPLLIVHAAGGADVEDLARTSPASVHTIEIDPLIGPQPFQARNAAAALGLSGKTARLAADAIHALARAFWDLDATLAELNPLALTSEGRILALDTKMTFDDNALFRHPELSALRDSQLRSNEERLAEKHHLSYVPLQGTIGCIVNGAGLAMATLDLIRLQGGEPANFLDVGGGATAPQIAAGFKILEGNPAVRAILVNIFGGIMHCDTVAQGILRAARETPPSVPVIVRLEGTNAQEGWKLLRPAVAGLGLLEARDMEEAARLAVRAART